MLFRSNGEIEKYATTTDDDGNETYKTDAEGNILTDTVSKVDSNTNYKGVPYYQAQLNQFISISPFNSPPNEVLYMLNGCPVSHCMSYRPAASDTFLGSSLETV